MSQKSDIIKKNIANPPKTFYNGSNIALWGTFKEGLMKNFKLFLLSGVFCILIVSVAIAETRNCAATRPTCADLGYKWDCGVKSYHSDHILDCPWDPTKKYCPAATEEDSYASDPETEKVDCTRKDCATLGFNNDAGDCPYNYIPCPFDQSKVFCAYPSTPVYNPPAPSGGTGNSGSTTVPGGGVDEGVSDSVVVGGLKP